MYNKCMSTIDIHIQNQGKIFTATTTANGQNATYQGLSLDKFGENVVIAFTDDAVDTVKVYQSLPAEVISTVSDFTAERETFAQALIKYNKDANTALAALREQGMSVAEAGSLLGMTRTHAQAVIESGETDTWQNIHGRAVMAKDPKSIDSDSVLIGEYTRGDKNNVIVEPGSNKGLSDVVRSAWVKVFGAPIADEPETDVDNQDDDDAQDVLDEDDRFGAETDAIIEGADTSDSDDAETEFFDEDVETSTNDDNEE